IVVAEEGAQSMQCRGQRARGHIALFIRPEGIEQLLLANISSTERNDRLEQRQGLLGCFARKLERSPVSKHFEPPQTVDTKRPWPVACDRCRRWPVDTTNQLLHILHVAGPRQRLGKQARAHLSLQTQEELELILATACERCTQQLATGRSVATLQRKVRLGQV